MNQQRHCPVRPDIRKKVCVLDFPLCPLGFSSDGSYYYARAVDTRSVGDIYAVDFNATAGDVLGRPRRIIEHHEGHNTLPSWSSDGHYLAYASHQDGAKLVIRDMKTGEEQGLQPKLQWWVNPSEYSPMWKPDGSSILVTGLLNGIWGLYSNHRLVATIGRDLQTSGRPLPGERASARAGLPAAVHID